MPYFAFIDGMRALAVLGVIAFHFDMGVSGGFIGVDIFFVLSGFLITSILASRVNQPAGEYFVHFYERRARRILPALIVMVILCCIAAYVLLLPGDMETFGKSLRDMAVFFSNFSFSRKVGYFDSVAAAKPLLHTWSLAVEEQFYLLFPPLLLVAVRVLKGNMARVGALLVVLFAASLAASIALLPTKPEVAFFLPHTRAWELLAGSLVAILGTRHLPSARIANVISTGALAVLLFCMATYTGATPFPGIAAVPPVIASALLIWANLQQPSFAARLLSWKPLVYVGLISYGLYLYHWPVLVFTRFYYGSEPPMVSHLVTLPFIFVLAALSFRFIEEPIRHGRWFRRRGHVFIASLVVLLATFVAGNAIGKSGLDFRFTDQVRRYADAGEKSLYKNICKRHFSDPRFGGSVCVVGTGDEKKPDFLVWGDSHAGSLIPAMELLATQRGKTGWIYRNTGCPPLIETERIDEELDTPCLTASRNALAMIEAFHIKQVLLAGRWDMVTLGWEKGSEEVTREPVIEHDGLYGMEAFAKALPKTRAKLRAMGATPWVMRQTPPQLIDIPTALASAEHFGRDRAALRRQAEPIRQWHKPINALIMAEDAKHVIDPFPFFCGTDHCDIEQDGESLYSDNDHLSIIGAQKMAPIFDPFFDSMR